jgi:hypothetical protein
MYLKTVCDMEEQRMWTLFIVENIKVQFNFKFYLKMYCVVKAMETFWSVLHTPLWWPLD